MTIDFDEDRAGFRIQGVRFCRICEDFCQRPGNDDVCCKHAMRPIEEYCDICGQHETKALPRDDLPA